MKLEWVPLRVLRCCVLEWEVEGGVEHEKCWVLGVWHVPESGFQVNLLVDWLGMSRQKKMGYVNPTRPGFGLEPTWAQVQQRQPKEYPQKKDRANMDFANNWYEIASGDIWSILFNLVLILLHSSCPTHNNKGWVFGWTTSERLETFQKRKGNSYASPNPLLVFTVDLQCHWNTNRLHRHCAFRRHCLCVADLTMGQRWWDQWEPWWDTDGYSIVAHRSLGVSFWDERAQCLLPQASCWSCCFSPENWQHSTPTKVQKQEHWCLQNTRNQLEKLQQNPFEK